MQKYYNKLYYKQELFCLDSLFFFFKHKCETCGRVLGEDKES